MLTCLAVMHYNSPTMDRLSSLADSTIAAGQWDAWVAELPHSHLLQSWEWGQLKSAFGWRPVHLAVLESGKVITAAQVLFRPLMKGLISTAYVPKGPLLDPGATSEQACNALLDGIHQACRHLRAISLKLEPGWEDTAEAHQWLQQRGFVPSRRTIQPRRTVVVDLEPDPTGILAQMKPKTRYNIRLAERRGVTVRHGATADLRVFYRLLEETATRQGFGIHTFPYYVQAWEAFAARDAAALMIAEYGGQPLAAIMVFAWAGQACYMYGASADEEKQRMPTYVVQWEAMRWARERDCQAYDLWGVPDVDESEVGSDLAAAEDGGVLSSGLGGLYRFKRGFGGREVRYVGAYDYAYNRPLYHMMMAFWNRLPS